MALSEKDKQKFVDGAPDYVWDEARKYIASLVEASERERGGHTLMGKGDQEFRRAFAQAFPGYAPQHEGGVARQRVGAIDGFTDGLCLAVGDKAKSEILSQAAKERGTSLSALMGLGREGI